MTTRFANPKHATIFVSLLVGLAIVLVTQDRRGAVPIVLLVAAIWIAVTGYRRRRPSPAERSQRRALLTSGPRTIRIRRE